MSLTPPLSRDKIDPAGFDVAFGSCLCTPESTPFKFEGSDGHGLVTDVPWVAAFRKNITSSALTGRAGFE